MTLWELKKLIAQKTKVSPLKLQLNRADTKKKSLTDNDNIKLLKDLKFESYEQITAQKKPMTFTHKVSLVNRRKELVPEAKRIFEAWFETFSDEGFMTQDTCVDFIKNSTNDPNVNTQDQRVTRLFTEYDKDKDGKLSKEEFLEFYRERAV
jgi:Ca2+-binding EF-hand superfamily protein